MINFWDERYSEDGYAYGKEPNDFLRENFGLFSPDANILCIAEGEGRNALFLAKQGFHVTSVDQSEVGIKKTIERANAENIKLHAIVANLENFEFGEQKWDGIVSIFGHLPPALRKKVHEKIYKSLKENGIFLFEAYTPNQIKFGTGGPKDPDMCLTKEIVQEELNQFKTLKMEEKERHISEGKYHQGQSAVLQFIGKK